MEAQVQLDQLGHGVDLGVGEAQRLHPLAGDLGADHVVVVEGDDPAGLELAGARLADVVHQCGEAGDEVRSAVQPRLEVDRLLEHGQRVLVDVLVPVVLVALESESRQLGQDVRRQAGLHQEREPETGERRAHQLDQLVAHPLGRDDLDPPRHRRHRLDDLRRDREAELGGEPGGAHHPQRVVGEGVLGAARRAQHPVGEVDESAVRVLELATRDAHGHRVDREVAPAEVAGQVVAVRHVGLARQRVVGLGAVGRDLDLPLADLRADGAERAAHVPHRVDPAGEQLLGLLGAGGGGEVEVVLEAAEHGVAHGSADQGELLAGRGEALAPSSSMTGPIRVSSSPTRRWTSTMVSGGRAASDTRVNSRGSQSRTPWSRASSRSAVVGAARVVPCSTCPPSLPARRTRGRMLALGAW